MKLHELKYTPGSKKAPKRIGRGTSSGHGKTSGKGQKGQNSRSGGGTRLGFEGGQTPIFRRIPKFGFTSLNRKEYKILTLDDIENFTFIDVNKDSLIANKIIKNKNCLVKILANGTISKSVNIKVDKISKNAKKSIENVGGKVEVL